jgi:hypothetical protein
MRLEKKLREHKVVPLWILPDKYGEPFNFARARGRAHFLLLVCAPGIEPASYLDSIAPHLADLRPLPVRALVVVASEESAGSVASPPFTVVIDADGRVREQYLPDGAVAGLFVLDRFADLYYQWNVGTLADLPAPAEVSEWMQAIGTQCSV